MELASSRVPDAIAADEVLAGVREELAREGALGGPAICRVEVLRADETSEGIGATAAVPVATAEPVPSARATRVGIVARALRYGSSRSDAAPERDTGDVRAFETAAVAGDARAATFQHADAVRVAARRAGHRLGARLLGRPAPSED